jgi:hypothetical protein
MANLYTKKDPLDLIGTWVTVSLFNLSFKLAFVN